MPRSRTLGDLSITIDAQGLPALAKTLKSSSPALLKDLRTGIRKAADPVRKQAQQNARTFSRRIPGAVKVGVSFPAKGAKVVLRVDAKKAPHGRPIENNGRRGAFRHPVFGDRNVWVGQAAHPFFFPAVEGQQKKIVKEIEKVADQVARRAGFR